MKNIHAAINSLIAFISVIALQGCLVLQAAKFSKAHVENPSTYYFEHGDGIVLKQPVLCLAVREGMGSADYRHQFIGPLFFTIIPFEFFDPEVNTDFFELELDFIPDLNNSIMFDPNKAILYLDDGSSIQPYAYQLWHSDSAPLPFVNLKFGKNRISLKTTGTRIDLRYKKPNDKVQMRKLVIDGLQSEFETVRVLPTIMFEPRKTHLRYVYPGIARNNVPIWNTFRAICK